MKKDSLSSVVTGVIENRLPAVLGNRYEMRPDQLRMALTVAGTITEGNVAVIEAGTGLGKSLAYLIPVITWCEATGGRAVVSTYTRNLQRQLHVKDFPLASAAAGSEVPESVLLGRTNYACRRNIKKVLAGGDTDPAFAAWLRRVLESADGDLEAQSESSVFLDQTNRPAVSCPPREAACSGCRDRETCYLTAARRQALNSQVVLVNHALLFSNLAAGGALLGSHDVLVVDEAHHLEDVATQFLTLSYGPRAVRGSQHSAYSPGYEELISYVRAKIAYESTAAGKLVDEMWSSYHEAMTEADRLSGELFNVLNDNLMKLKNHSGGLREEDPVKAVYGEGAPVFYGTEGLVSDLRSSWSRMVTAAGGIHEIAQEHEESLDNGLMAPIKAVRDAAAETMAEFQFLVSGAADDHVFYLSSAGAGRRPAMTASPIDVGPRLGAALEEQTSATVLTSATIAVDGGFSFALERLGLDRSLRVSTRRYDSPFDLAAQRAVFVASFLPDPGSDTFLREAGRVIKDALGSTDKRAMVLCTAKSQLRQLAWLLSSDDRITHRLFVQEEGGSREDLLERFKNARGGILVGLASFWEGVDLPGALLEILVILKLPFMVPTEPVVQARSRRLSDAGEDPFVRLFLPDVVLKLRQGIGRLIRTGSDRGVVIILDSRLRNSSYGRFVLDASGGSYEVVDDGEKLTKKINERF